MIILLDEINSRIAELQAEEPFDQQRIEKMKCTDYRSKDGSIWEPEFDEGKWDD